MTKKILPKKNRVKRGNAHLYLGKAGHLLVMSEFLLLGYNVATPEVDTGDDVYVVQDQSGDLWKIQVKTATASRTVKGFNATIKVPMRQLRQPKDPELTYIVVIRDKKNWIYFILPRAVLNNLYQNDGVGTPSGPYVIFKFSRNESSKSVLCGRTDVLFAENNWKEWPPVTKSAPKPKMKRSRSKATTS